MKPYFLRKIKVKNEVPSAAIFVWRLKGYTKSLKPILYINQRSYLMTLEKKNNKVLP